MEKLIYEQQRNLNQESFSPEIIKMITDNQIKETLSEIRGNGHPEMRKCAIHLRLLKKLGDREEAKRLANKRKSNRF
jgi:hypothetical protein